MEKKRALLSVYHKKGILEFAIGLQILGYEIVSSGGTAKYLKSMGMSNIVDVADITGFPAILDHRVVTLHPKIHGGILAKNSEEHDNERRQYDIPRFNIVCVDLCPVQDGIGGDNPTIELVMNLTDIGGPTMIRGAAKNHNNGVTVICDPEDRERVLKELRCYGRVTPRLNEELAQKVFDVMAKYDAAIRDFLANEAGDFVDTIFLGPGKELAYAENRDANPAYIHAIEGKDDPLATHKLEVVSGEPSYISIADTNQLIDILSRLAEAFRKSKGNAPYIVIAGKHGNPCGAAIDWDDPANAIRKALNGNSVAVMGGEVVTNFPITDNLAEELYEPSQKSGLNIGRDNWGLDVIAAPYFSDGAINLLGKREKRKLLSNKYLIAPILQSDEWELKPVRAGFLRQKTPRFILTPDAIEHMVGPKMLDVEFDSLLIAWACAWRASSNTVALAKDGMLIGLGCGQQDRIECVRLCISRATRAGHDTNGSLFASDAFFPYPKGKLPSVKKIMTVFRGFRIRKIPKSSRELLAMLGDFIQRLQVLDTREGPELLIDAGCAGGVVPGDGKNLDKVKNMFKKAGLSVAFLNKENRGFAKHG